MYTEHPGDSNMNVCEYEWRRQPLETVGFGHALMYTYALSICHVRVRVAAVTPGNSGVGHALMYSYAHIYVSEPGGSNPGGLNRSFRDRTRRVPQTWVG